MINGSVSFFKGSCPNGPVSGQKLQRPFKRGMRGVCAHNGDGVGARIATIYNDLQGICHDLQGFCMNLQGFVTIRKDLKGLVDL